VISGVDKSAPVLNALTISPSSVNTVAGRETVTVTATATDHGSGVAQVDADFYTNTGNESGGSAAGLYPYPGIGYSQQGYVNVRLTRGSGNTWTGTGVFRECEPQGKWHVDLNLNDRAGNYSDYQSKRLAKAGLQGTLSVTSTPGDVVAPYVYGSTASSQNGTITLDFSEGVRNVSASTLDVYATKPASTRFTSTEPISAITCSNGHTSVDCSGSGGLITSSVLTVPALTGKVGSQYDVFANQKGVTTQLSDGAGNPMDWGADAAEVTDS
jgi:hypothetical protein